MIEELYRLVDGDPADFERSVHAILSGPNPDFEREIARALKQVPSRSLALNQLERYLTIVDDANRERELLASSPARLAMLLTTFTQSQYLTDIVFRYPELVPWLLDGGALKNSPDREQLIDEALAIVRTGFPLEHRRNALRYFKLKHTLRIGLRDIFIHAAMASVTEDLSNVADACIEAALCLAQEVLQPRFGKPMIAGEFDGEQEQAGLVVIGMGKLGGRELNFSSDIDLVFIYGGEGETAGGTATSLANAEYFHRFGEHVIKTLTEVSHDGRICRVDMRLRPHGRMGPLSVGIHHAIDYYERYSQAWERQALVKARACAGDSALGNAFIKNTRRFAYPKHYDDEMLEEIREMKRQMEAQIEVRGQTGTEVKLGRGGIRDIEFTVQMLQMLHGGRLLPLQTPNTLQAIQALELHDILRHFEAGTLVSNYIFLRSIEHRLQIEGNQQVHALPENSDALERFAQKLGYETASSFLADYGFRAEATREILERFLQLKGSGALWISDLLNPLSDGEASLPKLAELGFKHPQRVREEMLALSSGTSVRPHTGHVRQQFARIAPSLLRALARTNDPDATLGRLTQIIGNLRAPSAIYDIIRWAPTLCDYLVLLVENSKMLAGILTRDPGLFETFGHSGALEAPATLESLEAQFEQLSKAYDSQAAVYRLRDGEMLRIGLRDLLLGPSIFQIGNELTCLAHVCLRHVYLEARQRASGRFGEQAFHFCILGLGKLGGFEMGYGSDLDLVFVYDAAGSAQLDVTASEYCANVATHIIKLLKEPSQYGMLYDIDARLRPDGKKGVLAVSIERFEQYYRDEAESWERLALVKARVVAGDAVFGSRVEECARSIVFAGPLTRPELDRIEEVRQRIVSQASPLDLKKDEGGIAEIEFTLRLLQLRYAHLHPAIARGDVQGSLKNLRESAVLSAESALAIEESYMLFRRIENRIRMMEGRPGSTLPESAAERANLAARLKIPGDLRMLVCEHKRRVHQIYIQTLSKLVAALPE
jgi:glutamate-ammonia-ligase adenylyltransferase